MLFISNRQSFLKINRPLITRVVRATLKKAGYERSAVSLSIVDNREIRQLNRQYLGRNEVTDVISFPLSSPADPPGDNLIGEVVVSAQKALQEAHRRKLHPQSELLLYIIHGVLHLIGYDDTKLVARLKMEQAQESIILSLPAVPPRPNAV
jgi:probable rRNA maturation factor